MKKKAGLGGFSSKGWEWPLACAGRMWVGSFCLRYRDEWKGRGQIQRPWADCPGWVLGAGGRVVLLRTDLLARPIAFFVCFLREYGTWHLGEAYTGLLVP